MKLKSLRTKFIVGALGLVLLLGLGVILLTRVALTDLLEAQLEKRGLFIAKSFAEEAVAPILTENALSLQLLCLDHKMIESDLEYFFVVNSKYTVLAHTFGDTFPVELREANAINAGQTHSIRTLITENGAILDIAAPILRGDLGTVHVGLSAEPIKKGVAGIIKYIVWIIVGVLAFGSIIAVLFTIRITRPLAEFAEAAKSAGSGDLHSRVAVRTQDEIGQLAGTFNKMLDDLRSTTVSRGHLERLVEERTADLSEANKLLLSGIAERTRAQEALKENNAKLQALLEAIPDTVFFKDTGGRYLMVNSAFEKLFGADRELFIGKTDEDLMPPELAAGCRKSDEALMKNGSPLCVDDTMTGGNGEKIYLDSVKAPIYDPEGNLLGIVGVSRDVTERKRAAETIERLSRRNELILESAGEGICGIDLDGIITFVNPAAARMTGWHADELVGRSQHEALHHTLWDGAPHRPEDCSIYASMRDGVVRRVTDEVFWKKDGAHFPVEYVSTPIREGGAIVGAVIVFNDITERKEIEKAMLSVTVRANEEKAKTEAIIAAIGDGISIQDINYKILYQNKAAQSFYGEHVGEYCYKAYQERAHPCERCHLTMAFKDGKVHKQEQKRTTDKGTFYYEITASPLRDASGAIVAGIELIREITERKAAENALRISEERLSRAQKTAHVGNWQKNFDTGHLYWSEEVYRIYGVDPARFTPTTEAFRKAIHPEDLERFLKAVNAAIVGIKPLDLDYRLIRPDGTIRTVHTMGEVSCDAAGKPLMHTGTIQDITERKQTAEALRNSEAMLQAIIDTEPECVKLLDSEGRLIMMNRAGLEMLEVDSLEQVKGQCVYPIVVPEYRRPFKELMRDVFQGRSGSLLFEMVGAKGIRRWLETHAVPFRNEKDEIVALLAVTRDVTARKRAEEALDKANQTLSAMIQYSPLAIICLDTDSNVMIWNPAAERIFGWKENEVLGRENPIIPKDKDEEFRWLSGNVRQGEPYLGRELVRKRKDGTLIHVDASSAAIHDADGNDIAFFALFQDITGRKRSEEALRRAHDNLEILVKERTAELTMLNDQLRDLFTYIQDAREKERTVIAREIHDELGQALTALKIDLSWLNRRLPDAKKPLAEKILSMSELIEATIQSVKRISTELRPGILDHLGLPAAIEWQAGEFQKRTGIRCDIQGDHDDLVLDRERSTAIFRVFQETLTNIARHAKAKKVKVLLREDADGVVLHVEDNGRGISETHLSDPKSLGLIGMRERVHFWGGNLDIQGIRNKGTKVIVRIPRGPRGGTA